MKEAKIIIYCDGGALFNSVINGKAGFGTHMILGIKDDKPTSILGKYSLTTQGYITRAVLKNDKMVKKELKMLNVFPSDAVGNDKAEVLTLGPILDIYGSIGNSTTNNHGELDAVIVALNNLSLLHTEDYNVKDVLLLLDSTYVLGFMKKILLGILNIEDVNANVDRIIKLKDILEEVSTTYNINLAKVKAHSSDLGNDKADTLATMGVYKRLNARTLDDIVEYVKVDKEYYKDISIDTNMLPMKEVFNFYPTNNIEKNVYYGLNYKDISEIGKQISNVTYTIVKLKTKNEHINKFIELTNNVLGNTFYPYILPLQNLTNKAFVRDYARYGNDFTTINTGRKITINTVNKLEVANILQEPGLSALVMDKFLNFEYELANYVDKTLSDKYETIDITNLVYDDDFKIHTEFLNDKFVLKYGYKRDGFKKVTIKIKSNLDTPSRNLLKRYEKLKPKIILLLSRNGVVLEYKTILDFGDEFIYSNNIYSNKIILKETI